MSKQLAAESGNAQSGAEIQRDLNAETNLNGCAPELPWEPPDRHRLHMQIDLIIGRTVRAGVYYARLDRDYRYEAP